MLMCNKAYCLPGMILPCAIHQQWHEIGLMLMRNKGVPSARHSSACKLIYNDDFLPSGDVVHILDLQFLGFQGVDQVACPLLPWIIQV